MLSGAADLPSTYGVHAAFINRGGKNQLSLDKNAVRKYLSDRSARFFG
jgi:hypothetical protein